MKITLSATLAVGVAVQSINDIEEQGVCNGTIIHVFEDYHAGRDELCTLVQVRWEDGTETQHVLEEFILKFSLG